MSERILLLIEGNVTEEDFFFSMNKKFLGKKELEIVALRCNIYSLYNVLKEYDFDIELEKAIKLAPNCSNADKEKLTGFFSYKYLIFDFDFQEDSLNFDEKIAVLKQMANTFNNDSEFGLLLINYPMFESYREKYNCSQLEQNAFGDFKSKNYKDIIDKRGLKIDSTKLKHDDYYSLISSSLMMTNYVVNNSFSIPNEKEYEAITSISILEKQVATLRKDYFVYCLNTSLHLPYIFLGPSILKKL